MDLLLTKNVPCCKKRKVSKVVKVMRLTVFIFLTSFLQLHAASFAQRVTISKKNASLQQVFLEINQQTGYQVFLDDELLDPLGKVDIDVNDALVESVLYEILDGSNLTYEIENSTIVIKQLAIQQQEKTKVEDRELKGKVIDEEGVGIPGVSVLLKGTTRGTITDADGHYSLQVPSDGGNVLFSFVGMESQEITFSREMIINVTLKDMINALGDVVVTGYQIISRERATGSFSKVTSEDLESQRLSNLSTLIEGRVAGMQNGVLRGITSMNGMTSPLFVIDGFPVENTRFNAETLTPEEQLPNLNMDDIESITVLKDAAAASIYGARAANGVVVIITKKAQAGKTNISFSSSLTFSPYKYYTDNLTDAGDIINLEKQWAVGNPKLQETDSNAAIYAQSLLDNAVYTSEGMQSILNYYAGNISELDYTNKLNALANRGYQYYNDVEKFAKQNPFLQQYNIGISKSTNKNSFNGSVTYKNNKYEDIYSKDESVGINVRNSNEITKWLTVDLGSFINFNFGNKQTYNPYNPGYFHQPYNSLKDASGNYHTSTSDSRYSRSILNNMNKYGMYNMDITPLDELGKNLEKKNNFQSRLYSKFSVKFTDWLKYSAMFQYNYGVDRVSQLKDKDSYEVRRLVNGKMTADGVFNLPYGNILYGNEQFSSGYTYRQQMDFSKTFDEKHALTAIAGSETRDSKLQYTDHTLYGYDPDMLSFTAVDQQVLMDTNGAVFMSYMNRNSFGVKKELHDRFVSFYSNAGYTYDNKYTVTGSLRWDRSNLWGTSNKYQNKPIWSVGASWNISNEDFVDLSWLDMLKLRFSRGIGGNIDKTNSPFMTATYNPNNNVGGVSGSINSRPNPQLSWEKTTITNVGVDFSLLSQRLSGFIEVYNKIGTDLLANSVGVATEGWGYSTYKINNGEMQNSGVELTVHGEIVKNKNFGWNATLMYGHNKNEVTYVNVEAPVYYLQLDYPQSYPRVGNSFNTIYSYKWAGLSENGLPQVYDADGKATTSNPHDLDAIVESGSTVPSTSGSLNTSFRYKNIELSMLFIYQLGHKLRNTRLPMLGNASWPSHTNVAVVNKRIVDSWKKPGDEDITDVPKVLYEYDDGFSSDSYNLYSSADINVLDASNIRLSNISLSYKIPSNICAKLHLEKVKLNFNIENAYMWAKDEDAKYMLGGFQSPNYVLGLNVNF